jgi:hypothetical protein
MHHLHSNLEQGASFSIECYFPLHLLSFNYASMPQHKILLIMQVEQMPLTSDISTLLLSESVDANNQWLLLLLLSWWPSPKVNSLVALFSLANTIRKTDTWKVQLIPAGAQGQMTIGKIYAQMMVCCIKNFQERFFILCYHLYMVVFPE